jgi:hypothetical protein
MHNIERYHTFTIQSKHDRTFTTQNVTRLHNYLTEPNKTSLHYTYTLHDTTVPDLAPLYNYDTSLNVMPRHLTNTEPLRYPITRRSALLYICIALLNITRRDHTFARQHLILRHLTFAILSNTPLRFAIHLRYNTCTSLFRTLLYNTVPSPNFTLLHGTITGPHQTVRHGA